MLKLTKLYIANVGTKNAWYPGVTLPLTDTRSDLPTSTVFNLINQGGKTTLLSSFFSLFDTRQDRFLQHLSDAGKKFEDYFDEDGLPAFIVAEWMLPDNMPEPRRLVTGQIVTMHKANDVLTAHRQFFSFRSNGKLTLDNLPVPNLQGAKALRSREDCLRWLHQCAQDYPGNFQSFNVQEDWQKHLVSLGIDVELLKIQVDFNRKEGAMDDSFLDFRTEKDFMERFLTITLNPETSSETQKLVASLCRKMGNRKQLQDALHQMGRLGAAFGPFAVSAEGYRTTQLEQERLERLAANALVTLQHHQKRFADTQKEEQFQAEAKKTEADEAAGKAENARAAGEAFRAEQQQRLMTQAEQDARDKTSALDKARARGDMIEAARLLDEIKAISQAIVRLDEAIAQTNKDIEPLKVKARHSGSLLRYRVKQRQTSAGQERQQLQEHVAERTTRLSLLGDEKRQLQQKRHAAESGAAQARTKVQAADAKLEELVAEGVLWPSESVRDALNRINGERIAAQARANNLEKAIASAEKKEVELRSVERQLDVDRLEKDRKANEIRSRLKAGAVMRAALENNHALARAADAESCNPDSTILPAKSKQMVERIQAHWRDAQLDLARAKESQASLSQTGLVGHDPDVSAVVRYLSAKGVNGARPYTEYIANTVNEAGVARALALSDPGRYLGVAVPDNDQVAHCRHLLVKAGLDLSRPVVISTYSHTPAPDGIDRTVVGPAHDGMWSRSAAAELALHLAARLTQCEKLADELHTQYRDAVRAEQLLADYLTEYGNGQMERWKESLSDLEEQLRQIDDKRNQIEDDLEKAIAEKKACEKQFHDVRGKILPEINGRAELVSGYGRDHAERRPMWVAQLEEQSQIAHEAAERGAACEASIDILRDEIGSMNSRAQNLAVSIERMDREIEYISHHDDTIDAATELNQTQATEEGLSATYSADCNALFAIEQGQAASLVVRREGEQQRVNEKQAEFGRRLHAVRCERSVIEELIGIDYDRCLEEARASLEQAEAEKNKAIERRAVVKSQFEAFMSSRCYTAHEESGAKDLSSEELDKQIDKSEAIAQAWVLRASEARTASEQAGERARIAKQAERSYSGLVRQLGGLELNTDTALLQPEHYANQDTVDTEIGELLTTLRSIQKKALDLNKQVDRAYEAVRRIALDNSFAQCDLDIAMQLRDNSAAHAADDAARIMKAIEGRIDSIQHELDRMKGDFDRATESLIDLSRDAIRILKRAIEDMQLPDNVPLVGGKSVFKMKTTILNMPHDDRKRIIEGYMDELTADNNIPETGAKMAAQAIMRMGDGRVSLRLLKPVASEDEQYVAIDRISHSGAEKISTALFLYFVASRMRAEQRSAGTQRDGGVLVLDNPFAKATSRVIWEVIVGMSKAMGLQMIIATGINEDETLSVFRRHLRMTKSQQDRATGRYYVQVADYHYLGQEAA